MSREFEVKGASALLTPDLARYLALLRSKALPQAAELTPDLEMASRFLATLDDNPDAQFTFQIFDDSKAKRPELPKVLNGTLDEMVPLLIAANAAGCGVFVTVNETDGTGRKAGNITRCRSVWYEFDNKPGSKPLPETWPLGPSMIAESSPGNFHFYWLLRDDQSLTTEQHRDVINHMVVQGSDPSAKGANRVLRVPGFHHLKDPAHPHMVELREASGNLYTVDELLAAFPPVKAQDKPDDLWLGSKPEHLRGATGLDIGTGLPPVTAAELSAMLAVLPLGGYFDWLQVGMALHNWHQDDGLALWHEFSKRYGTGYNPSELESKWRGFTAGGGKTIGSIIQQAREAGYTAPAAATFERTEPNAPGDCLRDHHCLTHAQLMALPPPPQAIHDGYYRLGEVTVVIGASSVGKTTMLMRDAFEVAQSGLTVVTISAEDDASNYARKLAALAILDGCTDDAALQRVHCFTSALRNLILTTKTVSDPNFPEFKRLAAALRPYAPAVVILETASSLGTGEETNGQLAALAKGLIWLARDLNAAVVISHHTNKQAALNADTSQHAARGGSSFTANTRETINIVKPTSEDMQGVMAQYRLPAHYGAKYAFDEQAFKDGRVILAHHAKCANGPETAPRGYLRVSVSHGIERSFAPVSGALIRLERLDDGTAANGRIIAERQASAEKRTKMQAVIRAWIQDSRAVCERTYARNLGRAGKGSRVLGGFSGRALASEIDQMVLDGTLKKRPAPQKQNPDLMEICLPEEVEK